MKWKIKYKTVILPTAYCVISKNHLIEDGSTYLHAYPLYLLSVKNESTRYIRYVRFHVPIGTQLWTNSLIEASKICQQKPF